MSDEYFNPEITVKIKAKTEIQIKQIEKEQKTAIESITSENEKKIKKLSESIVKDASEKAESEFQKKKAKQKLEIRLKKTKFHDKLVEDLIEESLKKIETLTKTEKYSKSLEKLIFDAASTLEETELIIYYRKEDQKLLTKDFLAGISKKLKKDANIDTKFSLADKFISCRGGVILQILDGKIRIDNTYERRLERYDADIKRELSLMLIKE
ncbi:V-type proton ATPase subunit E [subsurface metagenome]|jgi:V/A-type H+-transporting ATPase subunit E